MLNQTDTIKYTIQGFDNEKYFKLQSKGIKERMAEFSDGKLYLEIGGKFFHDPHAARVLPGFDSKVKIRIFKEFKDIAELVFCINYKDVISNRQLKNTAIPYTEASFEMLDSFNKHLGMKPNIAINLIEDAENQILKAYITQLEEKGYTVFKRYFINGYPDNTEQILSGKGYGKDDYIETDKKLILVTGAASNSGKMSTCLGQIYQDTQKDLKSGYAKYETFPISELPLNHPINLAYEAATADIGDYNMIDVFHQKAYNIEAVNYNRDLKAFKIIQSLKDGLIKRGNFMNTYKSPTDMGISFSAEAITNDEVVSIASYREIDRRKEWYKQIVERGGGDGAWILKCEELEQKAEGYIKEKGYDLNLVIEPIDPSSSGSHPPA